MKKLIEPWMLTHRSHHFETIRRRFVRAARSLRWRVRTLGEADGFPLLAAESSGSGPQVYVSAGVHGDEVAGPEALLQLMESGEWKGASFRWTVLPCVNPWGVQHNRRTDAAGLDLNRAFHLQEHPVIGAIRAWVAQRGCPDLSLHLHEDYDAQGLYLYEIDATRKPIGPELLKAAAPFVPPDPRRTIEGFRAKQGWLLRKIRVEWFEEIGWPEAPWLAQLGVPRVITLETPSEFALDRRVEAQKRAVRCALRHLA